MTQRVGRTAGHFVFAPLAGLSILAPMSSLGLFSDYRRLPGTFDELFDDTGQPRVGLERLAAALGLHTATGLARAQALAELALLNQGVTFSVYADQRGTEKIFPFCVIPRIVTAADFAHLERGLQQRIRALSLFLDDVYGPQRILADGRIPPDLVLGAKAYLPKLRGVRPPGGVRLHIAGIDLIRDPAGTLRVFAVRCDGRWRVTAERARGAVIGKNCDDPMRECAPSPASCPQRQCAT